MMGQFVVVKPGEQAGTPPTAHDAIVPQSNLAVGSGPRPVSTTHGHYAD
jgi:hypothetical protein